jgi:ribosomal protein S18 acetylase RimI-like enzyme
MKVCPPIEVRNTRPQDIPGIVALSQAVYRPPVAWPEKALASHLSVFPEGQFVAVETATQRVVGMCASLIVWWDEYEMSDSWRDFTDGGMFTNHDPQHGHTLYAAEVMVHPDLQGCGIGKRLYEARFALARRLGLWRIRAGARLRDYHRHADQLTPEQYVEKVVRGELRDPTLSFQLKQGFHVIGVVRHYLSYDPESQGHAAVIEWLNPDAVAAGVVHAPTAVPSRSQ